MKLLAHIANINGERVEQSLRDHCFQTAEYARESVGKAPFHNTAYLAGILHDMGKAKKEYQDYLEASYRGEVVKKGSVIHTFAGVIYLFEKYHTPQTSPWERLACEVISFAVGSHHGMFDCMDLNGNSGFVHRLTKSKTEIGYEESVANFLSEVMDERQLDTYFSKATAEVAAFYSETMKTYSQNRKNNFFQVSMLMRLVLSAVIYGDRRDTSEFMSQCSAGVGQEVCWKEQKEYFERKIEELHVDSEINRVRKNISGQCLDASAKSCGIYRLNVPTGGGKTLCSLRYALSHAERYEKKRIIFIIPLLSVLDQNVQVIRKYLKDSNKILEHHSNLVRTKDIAEEMDHYELLAESWHAPVIVSTLVQMLEILFSDQTSATGRMQAFCDSVIVIDEVQSLPKKMTLMFNLAINFLHQFCNATIVLSSATQPCFDELKWPLHLSDSPDLVCLSTDEKKVFDRAQIIDKTSQSGMSLTECRDFCGGLMEKHVSLLVICNTKAEAKNLAEMLQNQANENGWEVYHLSTSMCQRHRTNVMRQLEENLAQIQKEIKSRKSGHRLICVSTQLIEAGVDLSFEGVVRILAGIDNLAQAAGRCNRSNEYGQIGYVYLVNLKNENLSMLREIAAAQRSTKKVLEYIREHPEESYIGENAVRNYYRCIFRETERDIHYPAEIDKMPVSLVELLSNCLENTRSARENYVLYQPLKTIGRAFSVFDQDTTDVLAPHGAGKEIIQELRGMENKPFQMDAYRAIMNRAKQYTVSLFRWQKERLEQAGLLLPALDGRILVLDEKAYDEKYGVTDQKEQPVENYIL